MAVAEAGASRVDGRSAEVEILLAAARTHAGEEHRERLRDLFGGEVDWAELMRAAQFHGVGPLLWWTLGRGGFEDLAVQPLAHLGDDFRHNAAYGLFMQGEAVRVLDLLGAAGIRAVPFKGPILATKVYGNVALRTYSDLDIVVRPRDAERARDLLTADSYRLDEGGHGHGHAHLHPKAGRQRWHHDLRRNDDRVLVELHWTFAPTSWRVLPDLDAVWARLEPWDVKGDRLDGFCPADLLTVLCVHGARHYWLRLLWVCDIAELVRANPDMDWERVVRESRQTGTLRLILLGLALAEELLGAPLPDVVLDALRSEPTVRSLAARIEDGMLAPDPAEPSGRAATEMYLAMRERWRDKAVFLAEPNYEDLHTVSLPAGLSGLYWAVRPLKLVGKYAVGVPLRRARALTRPRRAPSGRSAPGR